MARWGLPGGALLALLLAGLAVSAQTADVSWPVESLNIETRRGTHAFAVEVAREEAQRARGLMFRTELAPGRGMLFDFHQVQWVAMWMKNTYLSLDMLFIGENGRIAHIAPRTTPLSTQTIGSEAPIRAVLELAAGSAERLGIAAGDRVLHPMFGP
ncbi:MAG: DUF192 domain-containing protein [Alphaproteobacteria bacterium]|nr:DUF192 domain-containing protein [Alphaproteobacteria bacterium]